MTSNSSLREALDRTLRLMRDDVSDVATELDLIAALTSTTVLIVADNANLRSNGGQTAFVTAATLMARSGHAVHLSGPNVELVGPQPPIRSRRLISGLLELGDDLLPGISFRAGPPSHVPDLVVLIGSTPWQGNASRILRIHATRWCAYVAPVRPRPTFPMSTHWPIGPLAAGAIAAVEAFKLALIKLEGSARNRAMLESYTAPALPGVKFEFAPDDTPMIGDLGTVNFLSAGAINNCALFSLARCPGIRGAGRVIEFDTNGLSNLNRNALQRRSHIDSPKADTVLEGLPNALRLIPLRLRYDSTTASQIGELASAVVVGVDDIPTRWRVQAAQPEWLGIGATTHWSAMVSHHSHGLACAGCLHPRDEENNDPIPTVAFVSFWAGLLLAARLLRHRSGSPISRSEQQVFITPFRLEDSEVYRAPVQARMDCPLIDANPGHLMGTKPPSETPGPALPVDSKRVARVIDSGERSIAPSPRPSPSGREGA